MALLTVIVPIFNEELSLPGFISELYLNLKKLKKDFEILAIDDGSVDKSYKILLGLKKNYSKIRVFRLRKNFGKSAAYLVGFSKARGKIILTIDADGQDVPSEIKKLLNKISEGFSVVVGRRINRQDSLSKKISSGIWNYFLKIFSGVQLHDVDCGLKAFRKEVLKNEYFRGDFHRYLPVAIGMDGYKIAEVKIIHRKRLKGKSKYNILKIFPALFDFITNIFMARFGYRPMHLFGSIGLIVFLLGAVINFYLLLVKISGYAIGGRPLLILGLLFTVSGLQFIFTGFIGDLIIRDNNLKGANYLENE